MYCLHIYSVGKRTYEKQPIPDPPWRNKEPAYQVYSTLRYSNYYQTTMLIFSFISKATTADERRTIAKDYASTLPPLPTWGRRRSDASPSSVAVDGSEDGSPLPRGECVGTISNKDLEQRTMTSLTRGRRCAPQQMSSPSLKQTTEIFHFKCYCILAFSSH